MRTQRILELEDLNDIKAEIGFLREKAENIDAKLSALLAIKSPPRYLTRKAAAAELNVSEATIDNMAKNGSLPVKKAGRRVLIRLSDLSKALIDKNI